MQASQGSVSVQSTVNSSWFKMTNNSDCSDDLQKYQHYLYAVVYSVILAPGLLGNVLALWVFRVYTKETKKAVVFMMNLAVADLLQVSISPHLSVPHIHQSVCCQISSNLIYSG